MTRSSIATRWARFRPPAILSAVVGALALTLLGAAPVRAQAVTQSSLEGRIDKIRQGQRNARIAVDVLVAKHLLTPPDFPDVGNDGKWKNSKGKLINPPLSIKQGEDKLSAGFLPASLGVARTDDFDSPLGYCARGKGGIAAKAKIVYGVIWPGLDGIFQTNCADILQPDGHTRTPGVRDSGANGDDYVAFASLNYILGNAVARIEAVPDNEALDDVDTSEVAIGELRFVDDTDRLWRWNGTIWEDASGLADLDGDGDPDSLKLKTLILTGLNGPLRAAANGLVENFAIKSDATNTLIVTNGDGAAPGDVSLGLAPVEVTPAANIDGSVIPVPLIDAYGRVTGFDNSVNLQTAVGSFSWALGGNLNTSSEGAIGEAPPLNSNYLGTNDAKDLRLVTNGAVRAILDAGGTLTTGGLNVTGPFNTTGNATVGTILGGSLEVRGPQGQATPLLRIQNFVGETLTEQVVINSDGSVAMKSLGGAVGTSLSGLDRVIVSADTGLLSQVSTSALISANAWMLGGNIGTNPASNFIGTTDAQDFVIRTANIERMRVMGAGATAGFVGIGTNSPSARLDVAGTFRAAGNSSFGGTLDVVGLLTASGGVATPSVSNAGTLALAATGGSGTVTLSTAGSERLRVTNAGDVGIGTNAPSARLDVNGTFRARDASQLDGTLTVTGATAINNTLAVANAATFGNAVNIVGLLRATGGTETTFLNASGNARIANNLTVIGTSLLTGAVTANGGITTTTLAATTSVTTPLVTNAGTLALSATGASGTITASTSGFERLRITSGGRVGINTLSDATTGAALQVNSGADATVGLIVRGNSASQSADLFRAVRGGGTDVVSIDQRGNLTLLPFGTAAGNTNELRFAALTGGRYVGFRAPDNIGASLIWTLPSADGGAGNVLATNGGGVLQWINPLTASSGWTLLGNSATTSGGNLGAAPTADTNFIGTLDNVDLRLVTNNRVRAIITADGQFQTNNVAIGGGTINGTAIGNTSPSTGVFTTVTANTRVTTPLVTGSSLQLASTAGTLALQSTGGPITATTTGVERLRITTGGNVGIATNSPSTTLDVNGTFNASLAATFGNTVTVVGTTSAAKFIPTGGTAAGNGMFLPEANTLAFSTANTERLRIDPNGLVGIGMVPVRTLDITGSFGVTGAADVGGALTVGGATALNNTLTVAGASTINNTLGVTGLLTASGGVNTTDFVASGTGSVGGTLAVGGATSLADTLTVGGATQINNTLRATGATTLDSTLTVGGATQVNNTLGVLNLLTASGGISTTNLNASGSGSFGGNLGVTGSATVTSLGGAARTDLTGLDRVVMSDSAGLLSQVSTATLVGATAWALTGNTGTSPTSNFLGTRDAADLAIRTNNADRIRILGTGANAGFVGINTTAPTAMLDVNGSFRATGLGTFTNGVTVSGATTLNNNLAVGGTSLFTGLVAANGGINTTALTASGNGSFGGTLNVTGVSTLGTLSAGNTTITGTLGVNGATTLNNGLTVATGATSVGALTASGAVTLTAGTPNGVAFLNGSRVLTTGSALTFDGTNLATTGTASAAKFIPTGGTAAGNGMYLPAANEIAFSTNSVERLRILSGGNVGIGISNPSNLLDVGGSFRASGPANFSSSVTVATGGFTSLGGTLTVSGLTTLNNGLTVAAGNTSVGTLTASGAVTLSAGTPNGVAFLNGSRVLTTGSALTFDGTNLAVTGAGTASAAKFVPTGGTAAGNGMYLPAVNEVAFSTNGAERLRLDNNGNVGIGTDDPQLRLDVNGSFRAVGAATLGSTLGVAGATTLSSTLGVSGVTTLSNLGGTASTTIPASLDRIVMANNTGVLSQVSTSALVTANAWTLSGNPITSSGSTLDGAPTGSYLGTTSDQNLQLVTNGVVRAVITNAGQFRTNNVALGGGAINNTSIGATTANTGRFTTLDATGNATVAGTTTLTGLLTANGGVRTPTVNGTSTLALTADAGTLSLAAGGANVITASTNGAERLRITSTGLVGIGTTLPVDTLTVGGTFRATNNSNIGGTLGVLGATNLSSSLGVNGTTTLGSTLTVAGASQVNNTLRVTGLLTADSGVRTPSVTSNATLDLAALNADPITFSTGAVERMRIDSTGRIGIGTSTPTAAQVMIQNQSPTLPGLMVRGNLLQTGRIIDIQSGGGTTFFSIAPNGETRVARRFVTEDETAFESIAGGSPATLMEDNDRIVVANPQGRVAQVSPGAFVDQYAWGLVGNALQLSGGDLGNLPTGSFLGTTNARDLRLVTNNTVRAILNSADGRFDVAALRAGEVSSAANLILRGGATVEGLRVTTTGRVGVGANVTPDAQLQVNTGLGTTRGLVVNGLSGQTANLFEARVNNAARFSIDAAGLVSAAALQVADVGTGVPNTVTPLGYDRVVVANADGRLSQIAFTQLSNEATWLLGGNTGITSSGGLGSTVSGRFFGMRDAQPIRFVTDDRVRAILTAGGQFQTNDVAIGGGTINGTAIGNSNPSTGVFTTLRGTAVTATTSLTTPVVQSGGALSVTAADGGLALAAGGTTNDITFSTAGAQRLLLTSDGKLGLGTAAPGAQLQVNNTSAGTKLLVVNGVAGQTANLFEAQVGGSSRFTVTQTGAVTASGGLTAQTLRATALGEGSPNTATPSGYDRVVIAQSGTGQLSQIAFSQLTNENTWLLAGNLGATSGGDLGSAPTAGSRFLGTRDDVDLRFVTNNVVRALIDFNGVFRANQVALTGGTIDGVTIGGTTRAPGSFTTVVASSTVAAGTNVTAGSNVTAGVSVITPLVTNTGNLGLTAVNGALSLATTGAVSPGGVSVSAAGNNAITFSTNNNERLRIEGAQGFVGINTASPAAQLQVNAQIDSSIGMIVRSQPTAVADVFAARVGAADVFRVRPTEAIFAIPLTVNGSTTVSSLNVTGAATITGATRLSALGGTAGALSGDRVVVANSAGDLAQVARSALVTSEAWGLSGNADIGAGNFIGTTDANDLRFRTNNVTRVTITAAGQLQSANVALTGGSINGVTIGNNTAANGNFVNLGATTVNAGSVNTPLVNRTNGALTLSTTSASGGSAGALILAAGSESNILFRTTDAETERMRLTTDGRLGIGLTSPSRTLDVAGTFGATGDANIGGTLGIGSRLTVAGANDTALNALTVNGTSLTKISSLGGDRNEVVLSGFDRVVLANAAGELQQFDLSKFDLVGGGGGGGGGGGSSVAVDDEGIQLTLALARLNFTGQGVTATAAGNNITVDIPGVNGTLTRDPEFDTVRVTDWVRTPRIDSLGAFAVRTGGTSDDRLTITSAGDVGIGTTAPGARLQVATTDDSTVGLRITGISTSPAANLLEVGTTGSPSNFRVERSGTVVTAGNLSVTSGAVTFGNLGGGAGSSMGGNDRVIVANSSGRLSQVSPATFVASTGWSLSGNSLTATDPLNPPVLGGAPVDRFLGTTSATDLQFVTSNVVRALITAEGVFQSNNAVLTGGRIDGMPIGSTTRASGAFTTLAANTTITAGTSVTTPRLLNPGDITITAGVANPPPGEIAGNIAMTAVSGSLAFSTVGTDPRGISFSAAGNNPIVFSTDGRERMRLTGGLFGPIGIGTATPDELAMLQISASGDAAKGLVIAGTPGATDDLLSVGVTGGPSLTTVLTARRTGVAVTSLVPGTTALSVNGRTDITGSLQATESVTFNTLAGAPLATLGGNNRVVVANGSGVLSQVSPEGLVADYAWALTGNNIDSSGGALGAAPTGRFLGPTSNVDLRLVTNGLVRAIVTRGGQFQTNDVAIGGGTINSTPIGSGGRASGAFTSLSATEVIGAPGVSGGNLALTASSGNLGITANSGRVTLTARGAANPIVFSTRPIDDDVPRLTITPDGQIGVGTGVPTAQLQVESADDGVAGLAVNGTASATGAALLTVARGSTDVLSVGRTASTLGTTLTVTGTTSVPALNASGAVTFASLAGGAGADDADYDRVVVANSSGRLRQIARGTLVTNSAWGLSGNANTGPSSFLGTTDDADLRFGTNGAIRATLTSGGVFQISNVAISGGTINGTTIGLTTPAAARFTTAQADTSVTTPILRNTGDLAVTTTAGNLAINAGGLSRITAATNGTERLRIDEDGRIFIGDRDLNGPALIDPANDSLPQMQVNSAAAVSPAVVARGYPGQVANILEVQGYDLATSSFQRELTVNSAGAVNLRSLSGPTNPVVTVGDRLVVSNAQGRLMQVDTVKLITATTWGLTGNAVITQPGTLGAAPEGNFLGTTDARDVGFVTNNRIRAMIDSGGTFRTAGNLVANGVTVGRGLDAMPGNTAVGTGALAASNGGDENSAFGTDALRLNTLGQRNTAFGVRAMQGNFVGLNNTAVGVDALRSSFSGNGNVALGFEAGFNEEGSNRLYIANSRTANLIVGDFANGRLLVNAGDTPPATLGAALQVNTVNAGDVGFIVRGASSQTANLFEARNNGGTAVARINNAGNANFNGTLGVNGATTLSSTLNVGGATALGNTLTVANTTTLNGATQINNTLTVTGVTTLNSDLAVGGNGAVAGTLDVTGATRLRNTVLVDGATTIDDTLNVTGNTTVGGTLGVTSTATATKFIPTGNVVAGNGMFLPAANEVAFSTNGAERLRLDNNGNVGVGTDDPQFRLDVTGSFRATTNATVGGTLGVTGATTLGDTLAVTGTTTSSKFIPTGGTAVGNGMYLPAANNLAFSTNGGERLRIDANGLVGIGAGTAARTLDVFGTFGATGAANLNSTLNVGAATTLGGTLGVSGATTISALGGATPGAAMGGNDRIVVTNSSGLLSNVSVAGLVTANAWGLSGNAIGATGSTLGGAPSGSFLGATNTENLQLVTNSLVRAIVTAGGQFQSNNVALGGGTINGTSIGATTANTGRFTSLVATGNATVDGTTTLTGLLTANGGVTTSTVITSGAATIGGALNANGGISTTSVTASGNGVFTGTLRATGGLENTPIGVTTANTGRFTTLESTGAATVAGLLSANGGVTTTTLTTSGAVTLNGGTLSGVAYLGAGNVLTTGAALTFDGTNLATTGIATARKFALVTGGNNGGTGMYMPTASVLAFSTNGGERLRIDSSGDVGIGTNSPQFRLDVNGTVRAGATTLTGLLTASGGVTTTTVTTSGAATIGGQLNADGGIATTSVTASGNGVFTGTLRAVGGIENTAIGVTTANTGRFTTLESTGAATIAGLLNANGGVSTTTLNALGTGTIGGLLTASGGLSTSSVTASGNGVFTGTLRAVGGIENTAIGVTTANTGRFTTLESTGAATIAGLLSANGGVSTTTLNALGTGTIGGLLTASGGLSTTSITASSDGTFTGVLRAAGGIENTAIGTITANTGRFTDLTAIGATTLTGLLTANGGVGTTTLTTSGNAIVGGTLRVDSATNLVGNLTVNGVTTLVNSLSADGGIETPTLEVTGSTSVGGLLAANGGVTTTSLGASGDVTLQPVSGASVTNALRFTDLTGDNAVGFRAPTALTASRIWTLPGADGDSGSVLGTDGAGTLQWINPLTSSSGWALNGNNGGTSGGLLGAAPTGRFLGTTDSVDLRLVTGNRVRAILTAAGQLQTNDVAIGGGTITNATIDNTAIGAGGASTGAFTTLTATSVATIGDATVGGALAVTGAASVDGLIEAKGGISTNSITASTTLTVTGVTVLNGAVTANDGLKVVDGLTADTFIADSAVIDGGTLTAMAIGGGSISGATIDNAVIGGATPAAGTFTALTGTQLAANTSLSTPLVTATDALQLAALASSVTISTASAERLRVDGLGNVGIGTNAPTALLDVNGKVRARSDLAVDGKLDVTGQTTLLGALNAIGGITTGALTATSLSTGTFTATGLVDLDGSFRARGASTFDGTVTLAGGTVNGIPYLNADKQLVTGDKLTFDGTTLNVKGTVSAAKFIPTGGTVDGNGMYLPAVNTLAFSTNGVERLRIGSDGRVAVAGGLDVADGATIGKQLQINGVANTIGLIVRGAAGQTANLFELQNDVGTALVQVTADGSMGLGKAPGTGFKLDVEGDIRGTRVFAQGVELTSDARFKTNIQAITDALSIVRKLQGVSYDWNRAAFPDRGFSERPQIGVIAQEVEKVLPELVSTDAQGFKSVNYTGFVPVLIEGMKQQADRLDAQDARLVAAEQTLAMVEERLFKAEEQVIKIDARLGQAEAFVARFELTREPDTMVVLTPTFKVQNLTADRAYIEELRAQRIEAEKARFKELDADGAVIDNVEAASLRGRVVNTGGKELFVSFGTVAPLFEAVADGHYIVSVTADDGSFATAQVVNAGGVVRVVPTSSQGIDVVAKGNSVGLVAPSKKVKASWTRTG